MCKTPIAYLLHSRALCDFGCVRLCFMGEPWCRYLHNVGIIVGCVCFISLTATCLERGLCRVSGFLAGSSFFVYAYRWDAVGVGYQGGGSVISSGV